jgi:signal transduction histidine kinase
MDRAPVHNSEECLAYESEAGRVARGVHWAATPLGPVAGWSEALKTAAASCLASQWPTIVIWGPELNCLYNDAYAELILEKHPQAMGQPVRELFAEIWDRLGPLINTVSVSGIAMRFADEQFRLMRRGFLEEVYFTLSMTPVKGTDGEVVGLICPVQETTRKVLSRRRLDTLGGLLRATKEDEAPEEVCRRAARALAENSGDIPCALIYLNEGGTSRLAAAAGVPTTLMERIAKQPLAEEMLERLAELRHGEELPPLAVIAPDGAEADGWAGQEYRTRVIPLITLEPSQPSGYLVAGLSPLLPFDADYRDFMELIGAQLGRMIATGRAVEEARVSEALLRFGKIAGPDLEGIIRTLTSEAQRLCNGDFAAFFTPREGSSQQSGIEAIAVTGAPPAGWEQAVARWSAAAVERTAARGAEGEAAAGNSETEDQPARSWLVMAVTSVSGETHGSLAVGKAEANQFGPRQERLLAGLLAHGAIAIDHAKLLKTERAAHQNLSRALAIRDNFLSIASHELRNPLNSLHLRLNILKREIAVLAEADEEARRLSGHVDKAAAQVTRMAQLLDRLLDIARIASGRVRLEPREYDLAAQVEQVAERFAEQVAPGQILVAAPGPVKGSWDEMRADQVITNLLSNAVKYGEGKTIQVTVRAAEDVAEIEVADHGIGIAADDHDRVFEQFERVENDQGRAGFGLGLWISRQIVLAMGGEMRLRSQPGEGATFMVRLPRRPVRVEQLG